MLTVSACRMRMNGVDQRDFPIYRFPGEKKPSDLEWHRRALAKGTARRRRNAPIWRGASNIYNALKIRKVPRPRYWAAGLLYFAGIRGEDLGIYPGDDLVQIYQRQSAHNNSKTLKRIEDRLRRNILVHWEEAISLYPEQLRRRLMKQYGLPLKKQ